MKEDMEVDLDASEEDCEELPIEEELRPVKERTLVSCWKNK